MMNKPEAERFWERVDRSSGCWNWTGGKTKKGYGRFYFAGRTRRAHRVAFEFHHGRPPKNLCCHRCDNPLCVRPDHLFDGTAAENTADMLSKGRNKVRPGTETWSAVMTDESVLSMRAEYAAGESIPGLRKKYNISYRTAWMIVRRLSWRHLP